MQQARGLVHLKTAGTSYLEALRAIAVLNPELFRRIYSAALRHYETDRASYHVSARLERAPVVDGIPLFRDEIEAELTGHPDVYSAFLQAHFLRHLRPFARGSRL